jgi:hypothetical protein
MLSCDWTDLELCLSIGEDIAARKPATAPFNTRHMIRTGAAHARKSTLRGIRRRRSGAMQRAGRREIRVGSVGRVPPSGDVCSGGTVRAARTIASRDRLRQRMGRWERNPPPHQRAFDEITCKSEMGPEAAVAVRSKEIDVRQPQRIPATLEAAFYAQAEPGPGQHLGFPVAGHGLHRLSDRRRRCSRVEPAVLCEKIAYLPDCYRRMTASGRLRTGRSRARNWDCRIGFVFCCFNNSWIAQTTLTADAHSRPGAAGALFRRYPGGTLSARPPREAPGG